MKETPEGYFVGGAFYSVLPEMIGKKIIHDGPVMAKWGRYDGSGCNVSGIGTPQDPKNNYVILRDILPDGRLVVTLIPRVFPDDLTTLDIEWSTGKWLVVE